MQNEDAKGASRAAWAGGLLIFLVSLAFVPFSVPSFHPFDTSKRAAEAVCLLVLSLGLCFVRSSRCRFSAIPLAGVSLLLWMILRTCFKPNPWSETAILLAWLVPLLMFLTGLRLRGALKPLAAWIGVAAFVQAAYMMLQYFGWDPLLEVTKEVVTSSSSRMIGTIGYHNQAAGFLGVGVAAMVFACNRSPLGLVASLLAVVAVLLTGCRGALIALVLASAVSVAAVSGRGMRWGVLLASKRRVLLVVLLGAALTSLVEALPAVRGRWTSLVEGRHSVALKSRIVMSHVAIRMWTEKPLQGWGAGEYAFQYIDRLGRMLPEKKDHATLQSLVFTRHAHNEFLQFAAEFGLVGLVLAACILVLVLRHLWRARQANAVAARLGFFLLTYLAVESLFAFPLQSAVEGPVAALLLGACCSCRPTGGFPNSWSVGMARVGAVALCAASLLGAVFFGYAIFLEINVLSKWSLADVVDRAACLPPWAYEERAVLGAELATRDYSAEAIPILEKARQGYCDTRLLRNLGYCLGAQNRWAESLQTYETWRRSGLDHQMALKSVTTAMDRLGRYSEAIDVTLREKRLWPGHDPTRDTYIAWLCIQAGRPGDAEWIVRTLLQQCGQNERARQVGLLKLLAVATLGLKQPGKAVVCWQQAIALAPRDKEARHDLALCLERLGRIQDARQQWQGLLGIDPANKVARQHLDRLADGDR